MHLDHVQQLFAAHLAAVRIRKDPRVTDGCATDHHTVAAGLLQHVQPVRIRKYISIPDHGDFDRLLDLGDGMPVGLPGVFLFAGAPVHRNQADPGILQQVGHLQIIAGGIVPAQPDLGSDGHVELVDQ